MQEGCLSCCQQDGHNRFLLCCLLQPIHLTQTFDTYVIGPSMRCRQWTCCKSGGATSPKRLQGNLPGIAAFDQDQATAPGIK